MTAGNGKASALDKYERWINNYKVASSWIAKHDVEAAVDANGGLVRIENFLPEFVAEGILATVAAVPEDKWNDTSASTDYRQNNISHSFSSVKQARGLDAVVRLFSLVRPGSLNAFSAAKYCIQDHIAPHDDRAYTQVKLDNGRIITTSRTLAVIYYLTRDWREEYGGVLVDLEDPAAPPGEGTKYVPLWNSVVAFRVPRYHAVTPMTTSRPRYSIFGWFLEPGKLYDLYRGEDDDKMAQAAQVLARTGVPAGAKGPAAGRSPADPAAARARRPGTELGSSLGTAGAGAEPRRSTGEGYRPAPPQGQGQGRPRVEAEQQGPAGKRPRDTDGAEEEEEVEAGHPGRSGAGQRQPGHAGNRGRQEQGQGRRRQQDEEPERQQLRDELGRRIKQLRQPGGGSEGAGEGGGAAHRSGVGGGGAVDAAPGRGAAGAVVRLPGRWQGRRKHVCVG